MRFTRENIEELQSILSDTEGFVSDFEGPAETWLDGEADRDDRGDARAELEGLIEELEENFQSALQVIWNTKKVVAADA